MASKEDKKGDKGDKPKKTETGGGPPVEKVKKSRGPKVAEVAAGKAQASAPTPPRFTPSFMMRPLLDPLLHHRLLPVR